MLSLIVAYRSFGRFRQASTHLDTPPFSIRHHPGSAIARGPGGYGTVFEIVKTAEGYAGTPTVLAFFNNTDGSSPISLIADANGDLFGTTLDGGAYGHGTVFEITHTPAGYVSTPTVLESFDGTDGDRPSSSLIADADGDLFGTTYDGGASSEGTVFEITDSGYEVVCFLAGTRIATPEGARAIETLRTADLILTNEGVTRPIRWLGRQTVATRFADPLRVAPICVRADALGENLPICDLFVSPDHALMVDGVFVQAGALMNGVSITREDADMPEWITYYHVELADHSLILAEGVAAETFIDNVDRLAFDNWDEHAALDEDTAPMSEMPHPRAKARRQVPQALRARLMARGVDLYGNTFSVVA